MGRPLILAPDELVGDARHCIGGKAAGLRAIHAAGLHAPAWCVLPFATVAARAWQHDPALRDTLAAMLAVFGGHMAVRSSAQGEDGQDTSHAGQFHTAFATTLDEVLRALDAVADSARGAAMAIVLQRALAPTWAGVAFSAQPSAARSDTFYVEAVQGHGQQLVDGAATPHALSLSPAGVLEGEPDLAAHGPAFAQALYALEDQLDAAVDLEWAIADDTLHLLQARPLTALAADAALRPGTCHTSWFFDQRFLEPISPFTRSTLIPLIVRASIGEALAMRGEVCDVTPFFYGGQAYVPHDAYARMLRGAPWWFLSPDLRQLFPQHGPCATRRTASPIATLGYAFDALRTVVRHRREVFGNIGAWNRFRDALPAALSNAQATGDFAAQWAALDALSLRFLALHRWSILWADYAFRAYTLLARVVGNARADAALHHGMHLPTAEANALLARARAEDTPAAWATLLAHYGHRSASLDFAAPTWAEIYAQHAPTSAAPLAPRATARPRGLAWLLGPVRRLLEMREEQRFNWERILAAQRALVLNHARAWRAAGTLAHEEDVWLLAWDEFLAALSSAPLPELATLVARRHALRVERLVAKPLFLGPDPDDAPTALPHGDLVQGLGASAGKASGTVVHLRHPERPLPADLPQPCILVVPSLDPAHTHLLHHAAGIVAERGGLLSHAAILAREYRVPMVTACEGAFARVPAGAIAHIDGQRGTVRLGSGDNPG